MTGRDIEGDNGTFESPHTPPLRRVESPTAVWPRGRGRHRVEGTGGAEQVEAHFIYSDMFLISVLMHMWVLWAGKRWLAVVSGETGHYHLLRVMCGCFFDVWVLHA